MDGKTELSFEAKRQNWHHMSDSFRQTLFHMAMRSDNPDIEELNELTTRNHYLDLMDSVDHVSELDIPDNRS
jgi:hypothetical protein